MCPIGYERMHPTRVWHRVTIFSFDKLRTSPHRPPRLCSSDTDSYGTLTSQQRYLPFGGVRADVPSANVPSTDYGYTGQRNLDAGIGLMDYRAHFYSPYLNRFIQPDTLIPSPANPQAWNRYAYVMNSPVNFNDPTGHVCEDPEATAARGGGNRRCDGADRPGQVSHGGGLGNLGGGNSGRGGAQSEGDDLLTVA